MEKQQKTADYFNFGKIVLGLVFLFFSTFIFISQFGVYDPAAEEKLVIGIFFCVAFFTIGAMLVFSSITFRNKMIYLIAPVVAFLGTFFSMNYIQLTGFEKIVTGYPQLKNSNAKMQKIITKQNTDLLELKKNLRHIEVRFAILTAKSDFQAGKPLDTIIAELKATVERLQDSEDTTLLEKLTNFIGELEKRPPTTTHDLFDFE